VDFNKRDDELQRSIIYALGERHIINLNKETGVAYLQAEFEDKVNPCVTVTKDEIRSMTGRQKVRDVVMTDFENKMRSHPGIDVTRIDEDTIKVCLTPVRAPENEFKSLAELNKQNSEELAEDPELGDSPY